MTCKAIAIGVVTVSLIYHPPNAAAHDMFPAEAVNPPSQVAESSNAKLTYLTSRAHQLGVSSNDVKAAQSVFYKDYIWTKTHLTVCFWNGKEKDQRAVMDAASSWTKAAPIITFDFQNGNKVRICSLDDLKSYKTMADIRINLDASDPRPLWNMDSKNGDWSYPGKAMAQNPRYPVTMNLADVVDYSSQNRMTDYNFTVRHEFGHALGLVHEHQRSVCNGWFNIPQIAHDTKWTIPFTQAQVGILPETSNAYSVIGSYDIKSVMQYNFSPSWYMPDQPGKPNPCRRSDDVDDLSEGDKFVIAALYEPELNQNADRIGLINQQKVDLDAATASTAASSPTSILANQKKDIEQALEAFRNGAGRPELIAIQVFPHPADRDVVLRAVNNLGFPLLDASGKRILTLGNPTRGLEGFPTNAILFTGEVSQQDVRYVALSLQKAGIALKSIEPYYPSKNNHFTKRTRLIQVGSDINNEKRKSLSANDILTKPIPMYGEQN